MAAKSQEARDEVISPLKDTFQMAGSGLVGDTSVRAAADNLQSSYETGEAPIPASMQGMMTGLGMTGAALTGVVGVTQIVEGAKQNKVPMMLSGAAELTTSAVSLTSLIPGAGSLAPLGAALIGLHGMGETSSTDRSRQLGGMQDSMAAATFLSHVLAVPTVLTLGLGSATSMAGCLRGLHEIKEAHDTGDVGLRARGLSNMATAVGVGLIATGVGVAPGIALALTGLATPLLRHFKTLQPTVDKVTGEADKMLYPVAQRTEAALDKAEAWAKPLLDPVTHKLDQVVKSPLLQPVEHLADKAGDKLCEVTQKVVAKAVDTPLFQKVDDLTGTVEGWLTPAH